MKDVREQIVAGVKRIVLKVGSRLLVDENLFPSQERIGLLVEQISLLRKKGIEVILVSSGAISAGMSVLGWKKRPKELTDLQAAAATGQSKIMAMYEEECRKRGFHCGQLLLTSDDVKNRKRHLNFSNCLNALLRNEILPVINENDSISVQEICFGENDYLAALVSIISKAELTVLLTSVDGMYEKKDDGTFGDRISVISEFSPEIRKMATGTDGNQLSTGGMETKLKAAEAVTQVGESLWIVDGRSFSVISQLIEGQDIGTIFPGSEEKMRSHKRWMAFFPEISGSIIIDTGAVKALIERGGSLLPRGIKQVEGEFSKGDIIDIRDSSAKLVAKGAANYSSEELDQIKGKKTTDIMALLGYHIYDEAVHRDNMVLLNSEEE
ncbi:MAG: glutamate 5-kinase [Lentisphaeraceae bacterium]|nr:glutamate 5-kinase [Lentisphaeraceae bacterium]